MKNLTLLLIVFAVVILTGCAAQNKSAQNAQSSIQDRKIQEMLNLVEQNSVLIRDNKTKLIEIEKRLSELEKNLNESLLSKEQEITEIKETLAFVNDQILRLDKSVPAKPIKATTDIPVKKSSGGKVPTTGFDGFRPDGFNVDTSYNSAMQQYHAQHYDAAITGFNEIINIAPNNSLADNAQYWIGECYFAQKSYQKALEAFTKVLNYSKSNKLADANYKIAKTYQFLGEKDKAKEKLNAVITGYPGTDAAKYSAQDLKNMGD